LARKNTRPDFALFSESGARFLVSVTAQDAAAVKAAVQAAGLIVSGEGSVGGEAITVEGVASIPTAAGFKAWFGGLDGIFEA
jgi:hypothetical protein